MSGRTVYTYVGNDPLDKTDPSGMDSAMFYTPQYQMAIPSATADEILDLLPITSEYRAGYEFGRDPSFANGVILAASVFDLSAAAKAAVKGLQETMRVAKTTSRRAEEFTRAQIRAAKAKNAAANGGKVTCTDCGKELKNKNNKSESGVSTPKDDAQVHHDPAIKDGGGRDSEAVVLCPDCHADRHRSEF